MKIRVFYTGGERLRGGGGRRGACMDVHAEMPTHALAVLSSECV